MRKHRKKTKFRIAKHINKLAALSGIMSGILSIIVLEDATVLFIALFIAVPLLFSNKHGYYH